MDDQYVLPSDLRHLSASSIFPVLGHQNATSSSHPAPARNNNNNNNSYQAVQPLISSPPSNSAATFPLVSGGALVDHHHHHSSLLYRSVHEQLESGGGAWNVESLMMNSGGGDGGEASNNSRWPRQETLTLLEIRSRLNSKFRDTNQKAPLWDEISRIMAEEHGYQRSGKKCKEKFENLYKYYKKTKEGKAGRLDGKHYRFFRQLEAIYGDQSSNQSSSLLETQFLGRNSSLLYDRQSNTPTMNRPANINNHESLSFSINSTEFETSSSENNEDDLSAIAFKMNNNNRTARLMDDQKMKGVASRLPSHGNKDSSPSWKAKVEGFVDSQMKKIMATQETWMEKMLKSVIGKEEERLAKEVEWRRQEAARFEQEVTEFWNKERAWVEARDAALMGALKNLRANESSLELPSFPERMIGPSRDHTRTFDARSTYSSSYQRWSEEEISSLIELRIGFGTTLSEESVYDVNNRDDVWEEIASKMCCLGYCRTANECREKWESVSLYVTMTSECKKKRREDYYKTSGYYLDGQPLMELKQENNEGRTNPMGLQLMDEGLNSSSSSNVGTSQMNPNNFFHLLFGEGENLWEKYGTLKLGKDKTNQH